MSQSGQEGSNVSPESPRGQHTKVSGRDQRLQETGVQQGTAIRRQQRPSRVVKTDQLFQNSPSKPSNGQPSEGLLQTFFLF